MRTFMNYSACWRSKEVLVHTSDVTHLTLRQNRVVIVSSVIAKIFNPSKCWMVTIQLLLNVTLLSSVLVIVHCQLLLFNLHSVLLFDSVILFDAIFCSNLILLFSIHIIKCSVLILEMCSRYLIP
jgi:hypothetical protein